jgi:Ca2+-binding RTX toxin-like protein
MTTQSRVAFHRIFRVSLVLLLTWVFAVPLANQAVAGHSQAHQLNVEPEGAVNELGDAHVLTATVSGLDDTASRNVSFEVTGPNDGDGNTPGTPDLTCTAAPLAADPSVGTCEVTLTGSVTGADQVTAWINDGTGDPATDADLTEGRDEGNTPGAVAEPDDTDVVEKTWVSPPACRDGLDNDGDGDTDYPADPGCESPEDDTEAPDPTTPKCRGFERLPGTHVIGTDGSDNLTGTPGRDVICGLGGKDTLSGGRGDDVLVGGGGDDTLEAGAGADRLLGQEGDDKLRGRDGSDLADFREGPAKVDVSLTVGVGKGAGRDKLSSIEAVIGTRGRDKIVGNGKGNLIAGLGGGDSLKGRGGGDRLEGGPGSDKLDGGGANDTLRGDAGRDSVSYASADNRVQVDLARARARGEGSDSLGSIEKVKGTRFGDGLKGDGEANTLIGGGGKDKISGKGGGDRLKGGSSKDLLIPGPGKDKVTGSSGRDKVSYSRADSDVSVNLANNRARGEGRDRLRKVENVVGSRFGDVLKGNGKGNRLIGGRGRDELVGRDGRDKLAGGSEDDRLSGGSGRDALVGSSDEDRLDGGGGNDRLKGSGGDDNLDGSGGDDSLSGSSGQDELEGDAGNDSLSGGSARDRLEGGSGNDSLNGGGGSDYCVQQGGSGPKRSCERPKPPPPPPEPECDPSYPTLCLHGPQDYDCAGGTGDGPRYVHEKNFPVRPPDPYELDGDSNGVGCET